MSDQSNDFDAGFSKPVAQMYKPGKPGDVIKGVYRGFKEVQSKYNAEMTKLHEVTGIAGSYHDITENESGENVVSETETKVVAGESYIFYEKNTFADDIKKAEIGQQIIVRFVEMKKPQGTGKPYKLVICKLGPMDPDFVKAAEEKKNADFA